MTMTIGRATIRATRVQATGDLVQVSGYVLPTTDAAAAVKAARQQLVGMVDSLDGTAVPVTWSVDPTFTGYYEVTSAAVVDRGPSPASVAAVEVALRRWGSSYAGVQMETVGTVVTRTNAAGATAAAVWGIPNESTSFVPPASWKSVALASRTTSTGAVRIVSVDVASGAVTGRFTVAASGHYVGAATIEHQYVAAGTYYAVEGRHAPLSPSSWRLSNGLLRITPSTTSGSLVDISAYNGSTWSTATAWTVSGSNNVLAPSNASGSAPTIVSARIIRNSVACCVLRLGFRYTSESTGASVADRQARRNEATNKTQICDITLRRGERVAALNITNRPVALAYTTVSLAATPAGTAFTGGVVATSADASGNKAVLASADTIASAPTTMSLFTGPTGSSGAVQYGIGYVVPAAAASPDDQAGIAGQYFGAIAEQQRAVLA